MSGRHRRKRNIWLAQEQHSKANSNPVAVLDRNTKEDKLHELSSKFSVDELVVLANRTSDHKNLKRSIDFENAGWHLGEDGLYEDKDGLDLGQNCKSDCCYRTKCCTCCTTECHPPCKGKNCKPKSCPGGKCGTKSPGGEDDPSEGPTQEPFESVVPLTNPDKITCPPNGWFAACWGHPDWVKLCRQVVYQAVESAKFRMRNFKDVTTPGCPPAKKKIIKKKCHEVPACVKKETEAYKKSMMREYLLERTGLKNTEGSLKRNLKYAGIACGVLMIILLVVLFYCFCLGDKPKSKATGRKGPKKVAKSSKSKKGKSKSSKKTVKKSKKSKKSLKSKPSSKKRSK